MSKKEIKLTIKIDKEEKEKILKYAIQNNITMSEVVRKTIKDFFNNEKEESEILKELKLLKSEIRDNQLFIKKSVDRLAKLSVKNGLKIFSVFHLILITIFYRSKDKNYDDATAYKIREESAKAATKMGIEEYNKKEE